MCQLLGMNCRLPATIDFSLEGFQARGGLTDEHKDGWGIAFFEDHGCRVFLDHQPAAHSPLLTAIRAQQIKSRNVIAHIRKATYGEVTLRNCHPFKRELWGQSWIFSHNGDLHNFHPVLTGRFTPEGETDSERAFCFIMERMAAAFPKATREKPPALEDLYALWQTLAEEIAAFGVFNIMLSNGDILFTHCSTHLAYVERSYPFTRVTLIDSELSLDLNAHNSREDRMVVIATKPLTRNEHWVIFEAGESLVFKDGQPLLGSRLHEKKPLAA